MENISFSVVAQVAKGLLDAAKRAAPPGVPDVTLRSAAPLAACSQLLHFRCALALSHTGIRPPSAVAFGVMHTTLETSEQPQQQCSLATSPRASL